MSKIKARSFKGTRDFPPSEMILREELIEKMKYVFRLYGFSPMETPALEMLEVLSGKYGDEGEKLIYKLDYKNDRPRDRVALRYDLTVPLARVIAANPNLTLPFKRYQIQPVWRADQPQIRQGRFREFYQCDVDIVGAEEGMADAEIIALTVDMIRALGFVDGPRTAVVLINHRRLLEALCELAGRPAGDLPAFCRALDKMDKLGTEGVRVELEKIGVTPTGMAKLEGVFAVEGNPHQKLIALEALLPSSDATREGIEGLRLVFHHLQSLEVPPEALRFDPHLARGLDYYTGTVFEAILPRQPHIGSLSGGGRYDKLIGLYSGRDLPAVGTTIGLDRIFAAMRQFSMLEMKTTTVTRVLIAPYSAEELPAALKIARFFRNGDIPCEVFPPADRLKKPFAYADKQNIPFVAVVGPDEISDPSRPKVSLKELSTGLQSTISLEQAIGRINK